MSLKWNEYFDRKSNRLETVADGKTWEEVATQLADALVVILGRIGSDLQPDSWNRIYIELWADAGWMIVYPHKRGRPRSQRALSANIEIPLFQAEHDKLPNPDDDPDNFESHYGALMGKVGIALRGARSQKRVKKLFRQLAENTDYTVWLQDADDTESMGQLYVL